MFDSDGRGLSTIEYRVENKYLVSDMELAVLSQRLGVVMQHDVHQQGDCYEIRSVYFDDAFDHCMDENDAGVDCRKKYRIRTYGSASSPIKLEIKEKYLGLTKKTSCPLTREEFDRLVHDREALFGTRAPLNEFSLRMRCLNMQPKAVIVYERTAFVHPSGNVRITFDRNIMASRAYDSFFDDHVSGLIPVLPAGMHVLEVKYDEMLPDIIARQLETGKLQQTAFSKYYLGRLAINGDFPMIL